MGGVYSELEHSLRGGGFGLVFFFFFARDNVFSSSTGFSEVLVILPCLGCISVKSVLSERSLGFP